MSDLNEFTKVFADFQKAFSFDQTTIEENIKTVAGFGEQFAALALDAASKSNDIATQATKASLTNVGDLASVSKDPSGYSQAVADFVQKQFEVAASAAEGFTTVAKDTQTSAVKLVSEAGETMTKKASATVDAVSKSVKAVGKQAA